MTDQSAAGGKALGAFLETARQAAARISGREAARRAGISGTRWRQVVAGDMPPARTIVAMAIAVEADPAEALRVAGIKVDEDALTDMAAEARQQPAMPRQAPGTLSRAESTNLAEEIERVKSLPISAALKIRIARSLIDLYAEQAARGEAERQAPV